MANHQLDSDSTARTREMSAPESPAAGQPSMSGKVAIEDVRLGAPSSAARRAGTAWASAHVKRAREIANVSIATIAERLDIAPTRVQQMLDGRSPFHLGDVTRFPKSIAIPLLRAMLQDIEASAPVSSLPLERRTLRITAHTGQLAARVAEAAADGVIDDGERISIVRDAHAVVAETTSLERDVLGGKTSER